jgi:hypothetical protein
MSRAFLFIPATDPTEATSFEKGPGALGDLNGVRITDSAVSATASLTKKSATASASSIRATYCCPKLA